MASSEAPSSTAEPDAGTSVLGKRNQPEDSEDDDVPLARLNKVKAKRWVEGPGKFVAKLDKTEKLYLERVRSLLAGGESDRRTLRRRKTGQEASGREERLNLEQVLVAARRYYAQVTGVKQKRPWKILGHADFGRPMGRHFQCLWHDVGYAGQDYSEWMPSDFCLQFEGLVEDYRKVCDTTLHHWTD